MSFIHKLNLQVRIVIVLVTVLLVSLMFSLYYFDSHESSTPSAQAVKKNQKTSVPNIPEHSLDKAKTPKEPDKKLPEEQPVEDSSTSQKSQDTQNTEKDETDEKNLSSGSSSGSSSSSSGGGVSSSSSSSSSSSGSSSSSSSSGSPTNPEDPEQPENPIITKTVTRNILFENNACTVTLDIDFSEQFTLLAIEENIPSGSQIINQGTGNTETFQKLKWVFLEKPTESPEYVVSCSQDSEFSGRFAIDNKPIETIGGYSKI